MCIAVAYKYNQSPQTYYFEHPQASLPVALKAGGVQPIVWGRRKTETGNLPEGTGLFLDDIRQGRWDEFFPLAVKLRLTRFAMLSENQKTQWYDLLMQQLMQGSILRFNNEIRAYCVYIKTRADHPYTYWPRIAFVPQG